MIAAAAMTGVMAGCLKCPSSRTEPDQIALIPVGDDSDDDSDDEGDAGLPAALAVHVGQAPAALAVAIGGGGGPLPAPVVLNPMAPVFLQAPHQGLPLRLMEPVYAAPPDARRGA